MSATTEVLIDEVGAPPAAEIARLTRAAYGNSDPLPGLDRPDGADESEDEVRDQFASGVRFWAARDGTGALIGCLRVTPHPAGDWEVHRVAVSPAWRGRGVAQALLAEVTRHNRNLWLNAVVERCLPPLYAGLGYRPVHVFPGPGKPLTEWRMRWDPTAETPWYAGIDVPADRYLCWFVADSELVAVVVRETGGLGGVVARAAEKLPHRNHRLAGVDALPSEEAVSRHLPPGDGVHRPGVPRERHPFHLRPRKFEPAALALCRFAPGREPLIEPL